MEKKDKKQVFRKAIGGAQPNTSAGPKPNTKQKHLVDRWKEDSSMSITKPDGSKVEIDNKGKVKEEK